MVQFRIVEPKCIKAQIPGSGRWHTTAWRFVLRRPKEAVGERFPAVVASQCSQCQPSRYVMKFLYCMRLGLTLNPETAVENGEYSLDTEVTVTRDFGAGKLGACIECFQLDEKQYGIDGRVLSLASKQFPTK